jgi:hypothetical protein
MTVRDARCVAATPHPLKVLRPLPGVSSCEVKRSCVTWSRPVLPAVKMQQQPSRTNMQIHPTHAKLRMHTRLRMQVGWPDPL